MPLPKRSITGAMFDVRPVDDAGNLHVAKISAIAPRLNLRSGSPRNARVNPRRGRAPMADDLFDPFATLPSALPVPESLLTREIVLRELEESLGENADPRLAVAHIGGFVSDRSLSGKPRYRPVMARRMDADRHHRAIIAEIQRPIHEQYAVELIRELAPAASAGQEPILVSAEPESHALKSAGLELWLDEFGRPVAPRADHAPAWLARIMRGRLSRFVPRSARFWTLAGCAVLVLILAGAAYGLDVKNRIIRQGAFAVHNLEQAKDNLASMNFAAASDDFSSAYRSFAGAGDDLNFMGVSIGSLLADLPGAGKLKSAQAMIEIGKLVAETGHSMSQAVAALGATGALLNPQEGSQAFSSAVIRPLTDALVLSDANLARIGTLLASVDDSDIPAEKRDVFEKFKAEFPQYRGIVGQGVEYAKFLERLVGVQGQKKYLVLFQNSSELRPTGGFPGSYGVVTFENGALKDFAVDDVYNLDGQLKDLIVPPRQLQHITPTWGMRDANWFVDFPSSSRKIMSFFRKEAGYPVDGVITVSPRIVTDILKVVGPIEMPEYGVTLTADNFLATVQNEVEYGDNKKINKPKKILTDMAPKLLAKLAAAGHDQWLAAVNAMVAGLDRKDILMYFRELNLESFALDKGFGGDVKSPSSDYVMVTFSNVKGTKSDAVTDNALTMNTYLEDLPTGQAGGTIRHKLLITRTHNGGRTKYGFYNRPSPAYVRVLVPKGSQFLDIAGNAKPDYAPLVDYARPEFARDEDLVKLEKGSITDAEKGIAISEESGKTEFGFWMVVDPGTTRTVELEYSIPAPLAASDYALYVQTQPGADIANFTFNLTLPASVHVAESQPALQTTGDFATVAGKIEKDALFKVKLR